MRNCLQSLREHPPSRPMTVFVIDNDSNDGTVEMIRRDFREVELFPSEANLGFSVATNLGIRNGRREYVLALNPDTRITTGSLDALLGLMDEKAEVGICGCRLELEDGTFDHAAKRSFPTPLGALGHFTGIGRRGNAPAKLAQYRAPGVDAGPVDAVNGAFMLMRRSALDQVGLFDEGYWMYVEDLDLCYRFKRAGWITWYEPSVSVLHIKAGTSGRDRRPRLNYALHYGMYRFYRTHYAPQSGRLVNALVYTGIGAKLGASTLRSAYRRRIRLPLERRRARLLRSAPSR